MRGIWKGGGSTMMVGSTASSSCTLSSHPLFLSGPSVTCLNLKSIKFVKITLPIFMGINGLFSTLSTLHSVSLFILWFLMIT